MNEIKNMDIATLIAECTAYDFKEMLEEKRHKSWLKSVSAFANTLGGSLFFGIDNDGVVKGLMDVQHVTEAISMKIRDYMDPLPEVEAIPLEMEGKHVLADVMAQLDYMEKRGSGLKKICNATKELETYKEGRDPVFRSSVSQFMTVIYSMEYEEGTTEKTTEKILNLISENPNVTTDELARLCNLTPDGVYYHTKRLRDKGVLIREGGRKEGHWVVKK